MSTEIKYDGGVIATAEAGTITTLKCAGKKMKTDITVKAAVQTDLPEWDGSYSVGGDVVLISFTIDGTEYQAEDGMTFGDWIASEYNTDGFQLKGESVYTADDYITNANGADVILNNGSYTVSYGSKD